MQTEAVTNPAHSATRATALLLAVAAGRPGAVTALQTELYPLLFNRAKQRATSMSTTVRMGTDGIAVPAVPAADRDSVAHDVTVQALERLVQTAGRFDPDAGDGLTWAFRQVNFCYIDVVRNTYQARRALQVVPTADEKLVEIAQPRSYTADPALVAEARAALRAALDTLSEEERSVILAIMDQGHTYAETALMVYGDAAATDRVDRVKRRAKQKLAAFEQSWNDSRTDGEAEAP